MSTNDLICYMMQNVWAVNIVFYALNMAVKWLSVISS